MEKNRKWNGRDIFQGVIFEILLVVTLHQNSSCLFYAEEEKKNKKYGTKAAARISHRRNSAVNLDQ